MKQIFTIILILMGILNSYAQLPSENIDLQWSKTLKTKKNKTIQKIVAEDADNFYMVMSKDKEDMHDFVRNPVFQKFDKNFNLILSQPVATGDYSGKFIFEDLINYQGELLMVYSTVLPIKMDYSLFLQVIDKKTLKPTGAPLNVANIKLPIFMTSDKFKNATIQVSPDKNKILFLIEHGSERTKPVKAELVVYDSNLNLNWSYHVELPHTHQFFELYDSKLDNRGNVHLIGMLTNGKREVAKTEISKYQFEVMTFDKSGKTNQTTLTSEKGLLTDMIVDFGVSGELICAGFYTESNDDISSVAGTYIAKIDPLTLNVIYQNHAQFTEEFLYQGTTKKQKNSLEKDSKKGKQPELGNYRLDKIHHYSDGSYALVAEQRNYSTRTSYSTPNPLPGQKVIPGQMQQQQVSKSQVFSYQNMLVTKFDTNGNTQWISKILKNQLSENDGGFYSSFAAGFQDDKLYVLFNDHPDNFTFNEKKGLSPFRIKLGKKAPLSLVEIDSDGKSTKSLLAMTGDTKVFARPKKFVTLANGDMLLYGKLKSKQRFGKLHFGDYMYYQQ